MEEHFSQLSQKTLKNFNLGYLTSPSHIVAAQISLMSLAVFPYPEEHRNVF